MRFAVPSIRASVAAASLTVLGLAAPGAGPAGAPPAGAPEAGAAEPAGEAIFCTRCGTRNRAGSRFCLRDGAPLPRIDAADFARDFNRDPATLSPEEVQRAVQAATESVVRIRAAVSEPIRMPVTARAVPFARVLSGRLVVMEESRVAGSGFFTGERGEIVTNAHVASPAGTSARLSVETRDGRSFPARLIGLDRPSDLALLKVDTWSVPGLAWGDADALRLGDETWAIGNPLDIGISVTRGTIATRARMRGGFNQVESFVHSDAYITHGNSGGPLVDRLGRVVGVSDIGFAQEKGQGYSIASTMARLVIDRLRRFGKYERGFVGLQVRQIDGDAVKQFDLKRTSGVMVEVVVSGSPAAQAGFRPGDVLFGINGRHAGASYLLQEAISSVGPGFALRLTLDRAGTVLEIPVTTVLRPETPRADPARDLERLMMVRFEDDPKRGLVVRVPDSFSPAPANGFVEGVVIRSVLPAGGWTEEWVTLDAYKKKGRAVPVRTRAELAAALQRGYVGDRVGAVFELSGPAPLAAVAFDESWPIIL